MSKPITHIRKEDNSESLCGFGGESISFFHRRQTQDPVTYGHLKQLDICKHCDNEFNRLTHFNQKEA